MPLNEKFELFFTHPSTVYICPALLYKICTKKFNVLVYKKPEEIRRKPFLKIFRDSVQHFHSSVVWVCVAIVSFELIFNTSYSI